MKMFWQFIVSVVMNFVSVVTGSILALYYVFATLLIPDSIIKTVLNIALPLLSFFIACYMAWRKQQFTIIELEKTIEEYGNNKPLYTLEITEDLDSIKTRIKEVDATIRSAKISKANAPKPHPYFGSIGLREPSPNDWQEYIDKLVLYKAFLQSLVGGQYHIVNFTLANKGHGDTNISIDMHFDGFTQEVSFYEDKVESEEPHEPLSFMRATVLPTIGSANKLGNRTEVQIDEPGRLIIEIDRVRHGDTVQLHDTPIFIKKSDGEKRIEYSIKSDRLTSKEIGIVSL